MKNPIKWYKNLWPAERYETKNMLIAIVVLAVTLAILVAMFVYTYTADVRPRWPFAVQAGAVALGGMLVGVFYYARAMRGRGK